MKKRFFTGTLLLFAACFFAGRASAVPFADKVVGDTRDACDGNDTVKFESKDGPVSVRRNESKTAELPSSTREIHWYCAGSRERSANDTPFNVVQITRAGNGAIHWVFLVRTASTGSSTGSGAPGSSTGSSSGSSSSGSIVRVGDTKDACDRSHIVRVHNTLPKAL